MSAINTDQPTASDLVYPPPDWNPTPAQLPLWIDLQRGVPNILAICHRQLGKDELFLKDCCSQALAVPANYVYCLPETEHVRKALWKSINPQTGVSRIDEAFPPELRMKRLDNEMTIEIPCIDGKNTSLILFTGSDNHKGLRGMSARGYYFSEWAFSDPQSLGVIRPIVEKNGGFMRFNTTAFGENHAYKMLLTNRNKPDWACHLITNNKMHVLATDPSGAGIHHMQSHQISEQRMQTILEENIDLYGPEIGVAITEQEYECSFQQIVPGSFYLDLLLKAEREGRIMNLAPRRDLPVYAAFDLGFTDPTSIWYVQIKEDGWIDVIDFDEFTRASMPEMIPDIKAKSWYYASLMLPHDGPHHEVTSGTTTEQILQAAGFTVQVMPRTDDATQIPSVRSLIPRCRFASTPTVKRGLECLRHFHNKAKMEGGRTSWSPKPVHDWCLAKGSLVLTPDGWQAIETLSVNNHVLTPLGARAILRAGIVRMTAEWTMIQGIRCTPEHRFFTSLGLREAHVIESCQEGLWTRDSWGLRFLAYLCAGLRFGFMDAITLATPLDHDVKDGLASSFIGWSMRLFMAAYRMVMTSIIKTAIHGIPILRTWRHSPVSSTDHRINLSRAFNASAWSVELSSGVTRSSGKRVPQNVSESGTLDMNGYIDQSGKLEEPAYNITVDQDHCYFVKGHDGKAYLVANSSHGAKAFATLAYFAPELRSGVQPPKQQSKDPYAGAIGGQGGGWMR